MANSQFQYVRSFELPDAIPPSNWIIIRLDGRSFSKFTTRHSFTKPNDSRCLHLMNACAVSVLQSFTDVVLAYGQSDEYSFVLHESTTLFDRRSAKLATSVATMFTAEFCMQWPTYFPGVELTKPWPTFDGRCVAYPKRKILRDYLSWRQADCHVNNLYNTTFWNMVLKGGRSQRAAEEELKGSLSKDKNELLWSEFGLNYNNEDEMYKKGSVVYRVMEEATSAIAGATTSGVVQYSQSGGIMMKPIEEEEGRFHILLRAEGKPELKLSVTPETDFSNIEGTCLEKWGERMVSTMVLAPGGEEVDNRTCVGHMDMDESDVIVVRFYDDQKIRQIKQSDPRSRTQQEKAKKRKQKARIVLDHTDIIGDSFWEARPYILGDGE